MRLKDVIETKYTVKTFQERGYDEQSRLFGFAVEDLKRSLKAWFMLVQSECNQRQRTQGYTVVSKLRGKYVSEGEHK